MTKRNYGIYVVEIYEIGRGQWHARVFRNDGQSIRIDDIPFLVLERGLAWPTPEDAYTDACSLIDRLGR